MNTLVSCHLILSISDGSSGHIFTTGVAVVSAFVEFSHNRSCGDGFGCPTTAVAVVMNTKITSANN